MNGLLRVGALALAAGAQGVPWASAQTASVNEQAQKHSAQQQLSRSYQSFVENAGQWNSRARFLSRTENIDLWVTNSTLVYDFRRLEGQARKGTVVEMAFLGTGGHSRAVGVKRDRLVSQYLAPGADFSKVKTAFSFSEAKITSLYPGVDLRVYTDNGRPCYDVLVAPGANPKQVRFQFKGTSGVTVGADGSLMLKTSVGTIVHRDLIAFQEMNGKRQPVDAAFRKLKGGVVEFALGEYDRTKPLVIDPVVYGSYYGGNNSLDEVRAVVADADGGVFMTGSTSSNDLPVTAGPYGVVRSGPSDAFISKFQGDAYSHDYAAYFGGTGADTGKFIGLSPDGNSVWIAGTTASSNFPGVGINSLKATLTGSTDAFLIRWNKDANTVLTPVYSTYFGSTSAAAGEELKGFGVGPISGKLFLGGETGAAGLPASVNAYPGASRNGYITCLSSDGQTAVYTRYVGGATAQTVGYGGYFVNSQTGVAADVSSKETGNALAVDRDDNAVLVGTVNATGNQDTSVAPNPAFPTTVGVFPGGRLSRQRDAFIQKVASDGSVVFSALLGGANGDSAHGVAFDSAGYVYITGVAGSFDFPRTRDTYGQDFSVGRAYVTKLNQDGSQIVYSTSLNTRGNVDPTGIAVDQRGFAFVSGILWDTVTFTSPFANPNVLDPNVPIQNVPQRSFVPTTEDAPDRNFTYPAVQDMPATEGFLLIIDEAARNLVFGTYIGGDFDDYVFAPYTDRFGDVWICGLTDLSRTYSRQGTQNTLNFPTATGLTGGIAPFITPLAFKNAGGLGAGADVLSHYGDLDPAWAAFGGAPDPQIVMRKNRDGFVIRIRVDTPVVQTITLNPAVIPGGLGATSVATISLNAPAPVTGSGVSVNVTLSSGAASFDPSGNQDSTIVTIPPGQTTGTVTIYSNEVQQASQVDVKAEYLGSFQVARLTVVPWLQRLTLSPGTVVGGNNAVGVVTLSAPAPAGGVDVTLLTNDASLVSFPSGGTLNIPAGQTTAPFTIVTNGVDAQTDVAISATLLNVGFTQTLTLRQASLQSVTFSPTRVAGGSQSTGTVRLDGKPGPSGFTVDLTLDNGTAGYVLNPTQLTFTSNDTQKTFTVTTAVETVNTQRRVTATRPAQGSYSAQSIQGTLFVDANNLVNMTLNPTSIASGGTSTGTITIAQTAQAGGVVVFLSSSNPAVASVPASVVIPAGSTTGTFTVTGQTVATNTNVNITASRGPTSVTRTLTVRGVTFTLSANPTSIIGGSGSITGTVTLAQAAPAGGVTVNLTSSNSSVVSVPATVTVPAGQTTATFPMNTSSVTTNQNVTITGQTQPGTTASVTVQIRAISLLNVFVNGNGVSTVFNVKGGSPAQYPKIRVQLDAPAPAGGATVTFTSTNSSVISVPPISIAAGQTMSADVTVPVARVNRTIAVTITANYNGRQIQRTINVFP